MKSTHSKARLLPLIAFVGLALHGAHLHAATTNALDRIDFGAPTSEAAHRFNPGIAAERQPLAGIGALGQSYRAPVPVEGDAPSRDNDHLTFTLKVDPARQNYLTVRLWGGDQQTAGLWMQDTPRQYGAMDWNGTGGPPSFPGRFYYTTIPIPREKTKGCTSVELGLYGCNAPATLPGRPVYSAYTHADPNFIPSPTDPTGTALPLTGERTPVKLGSDRVIAFRRKNRAAIYGPGGTIQNIAPGLSLAEHDGLKLDKPSRKDDQRWILVPNGIGFMLFNHASGLSTDVLYGSTDKGQSVVTQPYTSSPNQIWHFGPVNEALRSRP